MRRALRRRNYVLDRMAEEGYITKAMAAEATKKPIKASGQPTQEESIAPYFVEEVRKYMERKYGAKQLYENGLSVYTSLDVDLQIGANRALDAGLRKLDKRRGFRKPRRNLFAEGRSLEQYREDRWERLIVPEQVVPAVVMAIGTAKKAPAPSKTSSPVPLAQRPVPSGSVRLRIGRYAADLGKAGVAWTRRASAAEMLKPGDLIEVRVQKVDDTAGALTVTL